jgi:hypothetical protein
MDGPPIDEDGLDLDGLRIVPAHRLCRELRHLDRTSRLPRQRPGPLARTADSQLPPYQQGPRR